MKKTLFYGAIAVAALCVILGVYYLIPGIYHFVGYSNHRSVTMTAHKLFAGAFFVMAIIGIAVAFVMRSKQAQKA